jgi:hypothetical protein
VQDVKRALKTRPGALRRDQNVLWRLLAADMQVCGGRLLTRVLRGIYALFMRAMIGLGECRRVAAIRGIRGKKDMVPFKVYDELPAFERRAPRITRECAALTGMVCTKRIGRDVIEVALAVGDARIATLRVALRDFLHFGYFLLAIRTAMEAGTMVDAAIDRARLRESWEPRCAVLESSLCQATCHDEHPEL